jgi:3-phenylpropionate/cinnamic acid dioxygenase small subunit
MNPDNVTFTAHDLSDRAQIEDVLTRYTTALDTKDWALLEQVFSTSAVADYSQVRGPAQPVVSASAIAALLKATLGTLTTQHVWSNASIELNGASAKAVSYLIAQHWRKSDGLEFVLHGRQVDTLAREAAGWRLTNRVLIPIHGTGDPAVFGS